MEGWGLPWGWQWGPRVPVGAMAPLCNPPGPGGLLLPRRVVGLFWEWVLCPSVTSGPVQPLGHPEGAAVPGCLTRAVWSSSGKPGKGFVFPLAGDSAPAPPRPAAPSLPSGRCRLPLPSPAPWRSGSAGLSPTALRHPRLCGSCTGACSTDIFPPSESQHRELMGSGHTEGHGEGLSLPPLEVLGAARLC